MKKQIYKQSGFTLIELLVVLGIIAVLTGLATFNFNQARTRARDLQRKNDLKGIQQALELYKNDHSQQFPADDTVQTDLVTAYLPAWPVDPKETLSAGSWDDYTYAVGGSGTTYTLTACLENAADESAKDGAVCGLANKGKTYTVSYQ